MKNKTISVLFFIIVLLAACQNSSKIALVEETTLPAAFTATLSSTPATQPTWQPYSQEDYGIVAEFTFDDEEEFNYLINSETVSAYNPEPGILSLSPSWTPQFKFDQYIGSGIYLRYKVMSDDACYFFHYGAGYEGCAGERPSLKIPDDGSSSQIVKMKGDMLIKTGQWLEQYMWLQRERINGRMEVVYYSMIWFLDDFSSYRVDKAILPHYYENYQQPADSAGLELDVLKGNCYLDTVSIVTGGHLAFLWSHSESFQNNHTSIASFFDSSLEDSSGLSDSYSRQAEEDDSSLFYKNMDHLSQTLIQWGDFNYDPNLHDIKRTLDFSDAGPDEGLKIIQSISSAKDGLFLQIEIIQTDASMDNAALRKKAEDFPGFEEIFRYAPLVGDYSIAYRTESQISYFFTKQDYLVEMHCAGSYSGQCGLEPLSHLAQTLYERLAVDSLFPDEIPLPSNWVAGQFIREGYPQQKDDNVCFFFTDWVGSVQFIKYAEFEQRIVNIQEMTSAFDLGIGEHCFKDTYESPDGELYSFWLLVDGQIVAVYTPNLQ
ncbi:MAG: hypothetical protein AB2L18_08425 [Anaerolineaceae bacterium]